MRGGSVDLSKLEKGVRRPLDWTVEDVLDRLGVRHSGVTANREIPFHCVLHEDHNASASINADSGLWLCHGCGEKGNLPQLISRVLPDSDGRGLIAQLPDFGRGEIAPKFKLTYDIGPAEPYDPAPTKHETYDYTDENGELLYQVLRQPSSAKRFQQRRPDGKGGWTYNLTETRVPYRLPQLLAAIDRGDLIFICEGEKDVHAFEEAGYLATCNSGGAGKFHPDFGQWYFRGAKVAIVADRDQRGIEHALDVKAKLERYADDVFLLLPAHGKDAADHFHNGGKLADLILVEDFSRYSQSQSSRESATATSSASSRSLKETRLSDVEMVPMTWLFDGWIPDNSLSLFAGAGGIGKSTFLAGLAAILSTGRDPKINGGVPANSIIFTAEDDIASALVPRLTAAGADLERIFTYEVQNESYSESLLFPRDIDLLSQALTQTQAKLVILDPGTHTSAWKTLMLTWTCGGR